MPESTDQQVTFPTRCPYEDMRLGRCQYVSGHSGAHLSRLCKHDEFTDGCSYCLEALHGDASRQSPLQADEPLRQMMRRYPDQAYAMVAQMVAVVQVRLDTAERECDELRGDLALYERALGEIAGGTDHSPGVLARRAILDVQARGRDHA